MTFPQFSAVRLTPKLYLDNCLAVGAVGFILDAYDDGYDVEFSRPEDGSTIALLFLRQAEIEPAPELVLRPVSAQV